MPVSKEQEIANKKKDIQRAANQLEDKDENPDQPFFTISVTQDAVGNTEAFLKDNPPTMIKYKSSSTKGELDALKRLEKRVEEELEKKAAKESGKR